MDSKENLKFISRHIGNSDKQTQECLSEIGMTSLNQLIDLTIPSTIQSNTPLSIPGIPSEFELLNHIQHLLKDNKKASSFIGMGYNPSFLPPVIQRNILENPGWYTQYTPYQAEISQGRLEALINYQTMITELTGFEISNASLLDEATAAAEAMAMVCKGKKNPEFLIAEDAFPQTISVISTRAKHLNINIKLVNPLQPTVSENSCALFVQSPNRYGSLLNLEEIQSTATTHKLATICASDPLSLTLIKPPAEYGFDVCVGSTQRLGLPMGFGGPHAGFIATTKAYSRKLPGRIIGATIDKFGNKAYRMALQTREQHIRKEKATSNICTAQALLAIISGFYGVYHGPKGLTQIAATIHEKTTMIAANIEKFDVKLKNKTYFDTITLEFKNNSTRESLIKKCEQHLINLNTLDKRYISLSINECTTELEIQKLFTCLSEAFNKPLTVTPELKQNNTIPSHLKRTSAFMEQDVFNTYQSETNLMRYIKRLENKDLSLTSGMIPLGSCTMKLNAAVEMIPLTFENIAHIHPYAPINQTQGYLKMIQKLGDYLCEITQLDTVSFQPNSGAQGEYAGLLAIKNYLHAKGETQRTKALIPVSAHGTNPASAAIAGLDIIPVGCDDEGNIDISHLKETLETHGSTIAVLMATYPSTHGVFEEDIQYICSLVHEYGVQVYMDGANLNAQVGHTSPGIIGADICHINLHKTFSIPHGGGGPGMGPICAKKHLTPYLPSFNLSDPINTETVAAAPYSSASILFISYIYISLMGGEGLTLATSQAILNANYIKKRLEPYYPVLFTGKNNTVAHELIIDLRPFKKSANIDVEDIAKRLMDYSFHAPTVSWPVAGTIMIEPTESESKDECDRFCDALISIYHEIKEIEVKEADLEDNVLKNAPHTQHEICTDQWNHSYSRQKAAFPVESLKENKFWPQCGRLNQAYGDRNLICTCDTSLLEISK